MIRCRRRPEFERVGQDAAQDQALDVIRDVRAIGHLVVQDGGGTGQRLDGDLDRAFGLETAGQFMVIIDGLNVGIIDRVGQLCRVVGVDDDHRLAGINRIDDPRFGRAPAVQNKSGFGVGFAKQYGFGSIGLSGSDTRPKQQRNRSCRCPGIYGRIQGWSLGTCPSQAGLLPQ